MATMSLSLVTTSCRETAIKKLDKPESISEVDVPKEILPIFEKLQKQLVQNKKPTINNLSIRYSSNKILDYENDPRGLCLKVKPTPIIYLLERDWLGKKAKPAFNQELSLYHLIGHCVYNLKHQPHSVKFKEDEKIYTHPTSLMYPSFNWGKFSPKFLEKNQTDYQQRLLNNFVENEIK